MLPLFGFNAALCVTYQQDEDRECLVKVKSKGLYRLIKDSESRACNEPKEYL